MIGCADSCQSSQLWGGAAQVSEASAGNKGASVVPSFSVLSRVIAERYGIGVRGATGGAMVLAVAGKSIAYLAGWKGARGSHARA